jgi:hypothetical protein
MQPWLVVSDDLDGPRDAGDASEAQWRAARAFLNSRRYQLSLTAQQLYPQLPRVAGTPLLARPEWLPAVPVPLEQVTLAWPEPAGDSAIPGAAGGGTVIDGTEPLFAAAMPSRQDGAPLRCYADALGALARPGIFENRSCYRILRAGAGDRGAELAFGPGRYFDMVNTSEAIAHEYAAAVMTRGAGDPAVLPSRGDLPLRSLISDPTDLQRRRTMVALCTLVLRAARGDDDATMLLHWRDPARVATSGGLYMVVPAGMFQASDDAGWNQANDFDLWRCIVRELAEELLGEDEDYHSDVAPIDYDAWPLYARLAKARTDGTLRVWWLGAGTDPLTLATDLLVVAVFDAELFDAVFADVVTVNDEGRMVSDPDRTGREAGVSFCSKNVERFSGGEPMQAAGAALLRRAWACRGTLLG